MHQSAESREGQTREVYRCAVTPQSYGISSGVVSVTVLYSGERVSGSGGLHFHSHGQNAEATNQKFPPPPPPPLLLLEEEEEDV